MTGSDSTERIIFIEALNRTSGSLNKIINLVDYVIVVGFGKITGL